MFYGLYISAEGARAQSERLDVISNNLANADTAGFKRDLAVFQARYSEANQRGLDSPGSGTINDLGGGVLFRQTVTSFAQGPLQRTDMPNDLAIEGQGFFLVRKGDRDYLTRAGNFVVQPDGDLVTDDGYAVLNTDREPINIAPERGPYRFTADGGIEQPGVKTMLALVKPRSLGDLAKAGEYLFEPLAPIEDLEPGERHVRSGFLEKSGVRPTDEMMQLIETSRVFEANLRLIQNQDQMFGALIGRVLKAT
jgi:flagellar basal-body rod protein FlgF